MAHAPLAHGALDLDEFAAGVAQFGTDWLYTLVPVTVFLVVVGLFAARSPFRDGFVVRAARTAGRWTGLPAWAAGSLGVLLGLSLPVAALGFFWDVAWHIDIGRDEFLLSPPHLALLVGVSSIGVAGLVGIAAATATDADVAWRWRRWRVPATSAAMVIAGGVATVGWGIDELWHRAYGIDVTMWSPPHLAMIASASLTPLTAWLAYAEAGPGAGHRWVRRHLPPFIGSAALIGLSAWQLEFDLGVPQWQALYHPVLIAIAAGVVLTAARRSSGRGGALFVIGHFVAFRLVMFGLTAGAWGFSQPRFPLYLAAAIAVELAYTRFERRPVLAPLLAGLGIGTFGIAGEWLWGLAAFHYPWTTGLFPEVLVVVPAAAAATVVGDAFGRIVSYRPVAVHGGGIALGFAVLVVALAIPFPRVVPEGEVTVTTSPERPGRVHVEVTTNRPELVAGADRFGVLSWQGDGREIIGLEETAPGTYRSERPVPVDGSWKSFLWVASGDELGAVPIRLAADPILERLTEVPVVPERSQSWSPQTEIILREAHDGPAWPGIVAYSSLAVSELGLIGSLLAAAAVLARRRRLRGWQPRTGGSLAGRRVLLTGAAGGIGTAARTALERQGARVVGLDLIADRPDTIAVDVTDPVALDAAVAEACQRLGGLDVVICNAGIGEAGATTVHPGATERRIVDVNLFGVWHTIAAASPHLTGRAQIVVVASGLALATVPYAAAYTASKRGVAALADVLRVEESERLDVTTVLPGYLPTSIHDGPAAANAGLDGVARLEPIDNAADAIVRALERRPREIVTSRLTAVELWCARHLPSLAERAIRHRSARVERRRGRPHFVTRGPVHEPTREEASR